VPNQDFRGYFSPLHIADRSDELTTVFMGNEHRLGNLRQICSCHLTQSTNSNIDDRRVWSPQCDHCRLLRGSLRERQSGSDRSGSGNAGGAGIMKRDAECRFLFVLTNCTIIERLYAVVPIFPSKASRVGLNGKPHPLGYYPSETTIRRRWRQKGWKFDPSHCMIRTGKKKRPTAPGSLPRRKNAEISFK
jgi:hypothetical protein